MDDNLTDTPLEGNVALSHLRVLLFGDYLSREGLTEIAINRPGELHTKINGAWEMHASPVTLRRGDSTSLLGGVLLLGEPFGGREALAVLLILAAVGTVSRPR